MLLNPSRPSAAIQLAIAQEAAAKIGKKIRRLHANSPSEIDEAFAVLAKDRIGALIVSSDALFNVQPEQTVALAARHAIPTVYNLRDYVSLGGLMSYGSSLHDAYSLLGTYASRILKGATPADLPVQRTTKVELILNLKTAKALGLTVPQTLLARADEIIE